MTTRFFLIFLILPLKLLADPTNLLKPDFSKTSTSIPKGTKLKPFCVNPSQYIECAKQWSQQATPTVVYSKDKSKRPSYQLYLPAIVPSSGNYSHPEGDKDFKPYGFSSPDLKHPKLKHTDTFSLPRYYINQSNNSEVRIVREVKGKKIIQGGTLLFVPEESLSFKKPAPEKTNTGSQQKGPILRPKSLGAVNPPSFSDLSLIAQAHFYALYPTYDSTKGCVEVGENTKTEAEFCVTCDTKEPVLSQLAGLQQGISEFLQKASNLAQEKIKSKVTPGENIKVTREDLSQVCSVDNLFKSIIDNFNSTCKTDRGKKVNFDDFFKTAYCDACKQGIPPELMFSMMSIESAGSCSAKLQNSRETSMGLIQVNSQKYGCRDSKGDWYRKKRSRACLSDPYNNFRQGTDVLLDHYKKVNPDPDLSQDFGFDSPEIKLCKDWTNMSLREKDGWRRAVAAYNGGVWWVRRAIMSARDEKTLEGTKYLKTQDTEKYRNDPADWERVRSYIFVEKVRQGISQFGGCSETRKEGGSGRRLGCSLSNVAHTEAVLGRNNSSQPSMIDMWTQYKPYLELKNNYPGSCQ